MNTVWKFPFAVKDGEQWVDMPVGAFPIHFAMQGSQPTLWAIVNPKEAREQRAFVIVGTGHEVPEPSCYQGTCFDGPFVWHLFEVTTS
jgi:hypothetical protein